MDRNFQVRIAVGAGMFLVALVALLTFDGVPFKVIYGIFALVAAVELMSFFQRKKDFDHIMLAIVELAFLAYSTIFVSQTDVAEFWYIILGVPGYDVFAYLSGKLLGGKIFKKSRPFPKVSKNKTWEGTILGLIIAVGLVAILMASRGSFATDWMFLLCGPLALAGDLFESFLKRKFKVKDSNEILIKQPAFEKLEMLVGGSEGHGGFLDRIDSTAFTTSVLSVIILFI